jgi:hypothetical protein
MKNETLYLFSKDQKCFLILKTTKQRSKRKFQVIAINQIHLGYIAT